MLFCITAQYTPQALNDMVADPSTNRIEAVRQLLEAAGGEVISMYSTTADGPGAMAIFDVSDPAAAPAIAGTVVAGGGVQNMKLQRLMTAEEVAGVRDKARQIRGAYKAPGK